MKLLVVTQKVDSADPVLGFFCRWLREFSTRWSGVTVFTQVAGRHDLPSNVDVVSLGKDAGIPTWRQVLVFWRESIVRRSEYDAVFVHMTPIWVVLGWPVWFLCKKPIYLWYEARGIRWPLKVALKIVQAVFSASEYGLAVPSSKRLVTGHGIDTAMFAMGKEPRDPYQLISVGRITAAKRPYIFIDCLEALPALMRLRLIGMPLTGEDELLQKKLLADINARGLHDRIEMGPLPNADIVPVLQRSMIFLHASTTSLDKAVLEAMACGCLVVSASEAFRKLLPIACVSTGSDMAEKVRALLEMDDASRESLRMDLRRIVEEHHGLPRLIELLTLRMTPVA